MIRSRDGDTAEIAVAGTMLRLNGVRGNAGESVALSLRPEALRLFTPGEAAPSGWATLTGTLGETEYLGPVTRFTVTLADGAVVHLMTLAPPTATGSVTIAFDPQRVVVMDVAMRLPRRHAFPLAVGAVAVAFLGLFFLLPLLKVFGASILDASGKSFTLANYTTCCRTASSSTA